MSSTSEVAESDLPPVLLALLRDGSGHVLHQEAHAQRELAAIRAGSPVVRWFGVNEARVDALVSAGGEEFRVVCFSADGCTVDSLSVFRRSVLAL